MIHEVANLRPNFTSGSLVFSWFSFSELVRAQELRSVTRLIARRRGGPFGFAQGKLRPSLHTTHFPRLAGGTIPFMRRYSTICP